MTGSVLITGRCLGRPGSWLLAQAGAAVIGAHGLVHLMGTALLWKMAEPGELTYEDIVPTPGSPLAIADGFVWLLAAVVFSAAAILLLLHKTSWRRVALASVVVSTVVVGAPLLAGSTQGAAGVAVNALVGGGVAGSWLLTRKANP